MMKHRGIIYTLIVCTSVYAKTDAATLRSLEELEHAFPPVQIFDHSAELISRPVLYPPEVMQSSIEDVQGMPFEKCLTLDIKQPGSSPYALNLSFKSSNIWKTGDTGMIAFYCRSLETGNRYGASSLKLQFKPGYADWRGHAETELYLTKEWKLVMLPFEVKIDAAETPDTVLNFFLGGVDPHTIQLADLHVYKFDESCTLDQLPQSQAYYPGMETDAPWRKAANLRIEKHRKANLKLRISDSSGKPVRGARIHARLNRHIFGFGAAVRTPMLVSPEVPASERQKYSDILTRTCSKITPTNAMKWRLYPHFKQHMPALIEWCNKHNMTLRGHLLIWPGYERLPDNYDMYKTDPKAFRKDLTNHIKEFVNLYPDAFSEWDVMNEPYTETDFMDLLGKDVVLEWFETARSTNPNYLTYINDYGILSDNNQEHQDIYYDWIQYLVDHKAPLDGIGFQGHFTTAMPPEMIMERIDRYAAFGKKMQITECDFKHADTELQARFFEDFVTLIYSHPQMEALINWIYLEDDFRPEAALYRKDFTPTAMGKVWERLLTEDWHSEATLTTGPDGTVDLRGFKGMYRITVQHAETSTEHMIELTKDGRQTLILPEK